MRTILYGPVTKTQIAEAELFGGIAVTSTITEADVPQDPKVPGEPGVRQQHWRMGLQADAIIFGVGDPHMEKVAKDLKLAVYHP